MLKQIIIGLLLAFGGACLVYFSAQLTDIIGRIPRAEKNLGGTKNALILFGFFIIVLGFLILFGMVELGSQTDLKGFETQVQ
ncbi:hypothetical protein K9M48_01555 [Candidatus Gracilibacteria bacterium]|nr:hypothetical protein [Candidatus Gracilibacteria bacterium]